MKKLILILVYVLSSKFLFAQSSVALQWINQIGTTGGQEVYSSDIDFYGNIFVTGYFDGTVDFDPGIGVASLSSNGSSDIFIAKYDMNGNYIWAKNIGGWQEDEAGVIKVDPSGNFYISCYIIDSADFDPGPGITEIVTTSSSTSVIAKYSSDGSFLWVNIFPVGLGANGPLSVDPANNLYVVCSYQGTRDFNWGNGIALLTASGIADASIVKYDSNGNYIWSKDVGGVGNITQPYWIEVDGIGNIYLTGEFFDSTDFDPGTSVAQLVSKNHSYDVFIAKYNSAGNYEWAKAIGGNSTDLGNCVYVDSTGNVFVTGSFQDSVDFDPEPSTDFLFAPFHFPGWGDGDVFISKYDSSGNYYWSNELGSDTFIFSSNLCENSSGQIYLLGQFIDTVDFDPGNNTLNLASSSWSTYLIKYNTDGSYNWVGKTTNGNAYAWSLVIDNTNQIYISGSFENTVDFDMDTSTISVSSYGNRDMFIAKYVESISTSTSAAQQTNSLALYPNPAHNHFEITFPNSITENSQLLISNLLGEKILEQKITSQSAMQVDVRDFPAGVYVVEIISASQRSVAKLVKE